MAKPKMWSVLDALDRHSFKLIKHSVLASGITFLASFVASSFIFLPLSLLLMGTVGMPLGFVVFLTGIVASVIYIGAVVSHTLYQDYKQHEMVEKKSAEGTSQATGYNNITIAPNANRDSTPLSASAHPVVPNAQIRRV